MVTFKEMNKKEKYALSSIWLLQFKGMTFKLWNSGKNLTIPEIWALPSLSNKGQSNCLVLGAEGKKRITKKEEYLDM